MYVCMYVNVCNVCMYVVLVSVLNYFTISLFEVVFTQKNISFAYKSSLKYFQFGALGPSLLFPRRGDCCVEPAALTRKEAY